ncbi:hypothetical protein KTH_49170 [Thermosporothrix hazakensis]|nr:hypothetical protein KTH_49170 [Thermosporothrix hazakensis]
MHGWTPAPPLHLKAETVISHCAKSLESAVRATGMPIALEIVGRVSAMPDAAQT